MMYLFEVELLYNIVTERRIDEETHRFDGIDCNHGSKFFKHNSDFLTPSRIKFSLYPSLPL